MYSRQVQLSFEMCFLENQPCQTECLLKKNLVVQKTNLVVHSWLLQNILVFIVVPMLTGQDKHNHCLDEALRKLGIWPLFHA